MRGTCAWVAETGSYGAWVKVSGDALVMVIFSFEVKPPCFVSWETLECGFVSF